MITPSNDRRNTIIYLVLAALLWLNAEGVYAQVNTPVRIEQDWTITLHNPDPVHSSPQITVLMLPDQSSTQALVLTFNYGDTPEFSSGGIQLQLWKDEQCVAIRSHGRGSVSNDNEKWTFTTYLEISGGMLKGGLAKGSFPTFGNTLPMGVTVSTPTNLKNLAKYSTADTVNGTYIMLGQQRVKEIKISEVRAFDASGKKTTLPGVKIYE